MNLTSAYVRTNWMKMGIDEGIVDLVCALLDTGVIATNYSCEGHFNFSDRTAFCHHNHIAQVHFDPKNWTKAMALCKEILETVAFDELDMRVTLTQSNIPDDEVSIWYRLEYQPRGFWAEKHQSTGMFVAIAEGWTEERARKLLDDAFKATIKVCQSGEWRNDW